MEAYDGVQQVTGITIGDSIHPAPRTSTATPNLNFDVALHPDSSLPTLANLLHLPTSIDVEIRTDPQVIILQITNVPSH